MLPTRSLMSVYEVTNTTVSSLERVFTDLRYDIAYAKQIRVPLTSSLYTALSDCAILHQAIETINYRARSAYDEAYRGPPTCWLSACGKEFRSIQELLGVNNVEADEDKQRIDIVLHNTQSLPPLPVMDANMKEFSLDESQQKQLNKCLRLLKTSVGKLITETNFLIVPIPRIHHPMSAPARPSSSLDTCDDRARSSYVPLVDRPRRGVLAAQNTYPFNPSWPPRQPTSPAFPKHPSSETAEDDISVVEEDDSSMYGPSQTNTTAETQAAATVPLSGETPAAYTPWSETDGLPPPYVLSPAPLHQWYQTSTASDAQSQEQNSKL